jgi:hypothetical protein
MSATVEIAFQWLDGSERVRGGVVPGVDGYAKTAP